MQFTLNSDSVHVVQGNKLPELAERFPVTEIICQTPQGTIARAKIDTALVPKVFSFSSRWRAYWHPISKTHYVNVCHDSGKTYLHRLVTDAPRGSEVDHLCHDGLDNRLSQLRVTTRSENVRNTRGYKNKHGFRGVRSYMTNAGRKWAAQARINGKLKHLGTFDTMEQAASTYQKFFDERMNGDPQ